MEMPLRLEVVDEQNPNRAALMVGPWALFTVDDIPAQLTRKQGLSAVALSQSSADWVAQIERGRRFARSPRSWRRLPFISAGGRLIRLFGEENCRNRE